MLRDYTSGERKEDSYYRRYDTHFEPRKEERLRLLEIGVQGGGSLALWRKYFTNAEIYGIDIDPACAELDIPGVEIHIGDQTDTRFLEKFDRMDIVIDDGGHTMTQQQISFATLFPLLKPGGIYVIEDLHTSYWTQFLDSKPTTDFLVDLVNEINYTAQGSERSAKKPNNHRRFDIDSLHIYESIAFIQKK